MAKYYIKCGSLEIIYSTNKEPLEAAVDSLWETNQHDVIDDTFFIDERGFRNYTNADKNTVRIGLDIVADKGGWKLE